ncbi:MAG: hypothetical protein Q7R30_05490 [Acidobacteriota bacterium]|nr:hypothetical protein [Acidobacteriota bacterium]
MTHDRATGADQCYVAVKVVYDNRGDHDETGTLYVTNRKLVFVGESITDAPWSEIAKLSRNGVTFSALRRDRQAPLVFLCGSLFDSVLVADVAERCLHSATVES